MPYDTAITDQSQLRSVYREPMQVALDKVVTLIDEGAAHFITHAPFMVISTSTPTRADASPRGGPPGFVRVLDQHHIAWGDLTGNNRLDSFGNLLKSPNIGLVLLVPGVLETLRICGSAELVQDPAVLEACAIDGRVAKTAVVVTVEECYIQCGAALRRGSLWDTDTWPVGDTAPSGAAILKAHTQTDDSVDAIETRLGNYYDNYIWGPGGRQD